MPARILVVDDYPVVRKTICDLLHSHSLDVCGEAENGQDAVERVKELQPNLVLLDINMPKMNGIQAAFEIRQLSPSTKIIFLSVHECSAEAMSAIRVLGTAGFVAKLEAGKELVPALRRLFPDETATTKTESEPTLFTKPRRAPRYYFGAAVELTEVESGRIVVALVRILSLYGCFVKTSQSIGAGSKVMLNITYSGFHFTAKGRIVTQMNDGLGIEFTGIDPINQERLEDCLAELAGSVSASATH
jgi:two-component system, chemotaxis family, chemotaxis protein CheY